MTLEDLKNRLKTQVDEVSLLEVLDISAEELVDRFEDKIEARMEELAKDFDSDDDDRC